LESGHNIAETLDAATHLVAAERWEIATAHSRTGNPHDWRWIEARLRTLPDELGKIQPDESLRPIVQEAQKILWDAQRLTSWQELNREMTERFNSQREPVSSVKDLEPVAAQVKQALDLLRKPMDEARQLVAAMAPKLHEMMKDLAKKTEDLKQKTEEQAQQAAEKKPEQAQADAQQALAQQQKLNDRVETLKDALRADANKQDILKDEGRERARDADDALALLKDPPPKAEAALNDAAQAAEAAVKADALKAAAQEQQKLASALDQLAKHYENAESGKPEETRTALRATEEQTGIKEAMDEQFAKAQELAKMAEDSPEELLKKLEKALPTHPAMQQELSTISRNTLDEAAAKLGAASAQENQVARDVQKMASDEKAQAAANNPAQPQSQANAPQNAANAQAQKPANQPQQANAQNAAQKSSPQPQTPNMPSAAQQANVAPPNAPQSPLPPQQNPALFQAAQQQQPIAKDAAAAGDDIARAGRHEQRLNNTQPGEKLEALGNRVKETATTQVPKAGEALAQAQQAAQATPEVNAADEQLRKQFGQLQQAANAPKSEAPRTPAQASKSNEPAAPMPSTPAANATPPAPAASPNTRTPAVAEIPAMPQLPAAFGQNPAAPATPVEQMWMARTLDSLDAALHSEPEEAANQEGKQTAQGQQGQQGKPQTGKQAGQEQGQKMSQAQQAMNSAAQAAAAAMRASRAQKPEQNQGEPNDEGPEQAVSRDGAQAQAAGKAHGKLQDAKGKSGDWGKLPKQVAEQLTRGQNENVAGEYRNQVETYYKVIAEKSKKP
ncbi:MAG TPA: hypothetical protein VEO95_05245, partial [Chthoniobacteraceae bacterium]|nr:hypothetical protein [Chthoniobacteraceae bacterium]